MSAGKMTFGGRNIEGEDRKKKTQQRGGVRELKREPKDDPDIPDIIGKGPVKKVIPNKPVPPKPEPEFGPPVESTPPKPNNIDTITARQPLSDEDIDILTKGVAKANPEYFKQEGEEDLAVKKAGSAENIFSDEKKEIFKQIKEESRAIPDEFKELEEIIYQRKNASEYLKGKGPENIKEDINRLENEFNRVNEFYIRLEREIGQVNSPEVKEVRNKMISFLGKITNIKKFFEKRLLEENKKKPAPEVVVAPESKAAVPEQKVDPAASPETETSEDIGRTVGEPEAVAEKNQEASEEAKKIIEKIQKQKIEKEYKRLAGEEDAKIGAGIINGFKRIGRKIKRTFSLNEQDKIKEQIKVDELIQPELEKHIIELFSEAANNPELKEQREIFQKMVDNRGVFKNFLGHSTTQWIMDRRLIGGVTLGIALTIVPAFVAKSLISRAMKMALPVIGGGIAGAAINGFKKYAETSEKVYNAKQWADDLDKKYSQEDLQDPEKRRMLAAEISIYQDKIRDTKYIRGNESEALEFSMIIRKKMLELATVEENYTSTDLNADFEAFKRISKAKFEIDNNNRTFSADKSDIWDTILDKKKTEVKKETIKSAVIGAGIGVGIAGLAYTLTHFHDIHSMISGNESNVAPDSASKATEHLKPFLADNKEGLQQVEKFNEFHAVVEGGKGTIATNERMLKAYIDHYNQVAHGAGLPELKMSQEAIDKAANDLSHKYNPDNDWVKAGTRFTLSAGEMDEYLKNAQGSITGAQHEYVSSNLNFGVASDHSAAELLHLKSSNEVGNIIQEQYINQEDYVEADRFMEPVRHIEAAPNIIEQSDILPSPEGDITSTISPEHIYTPEEVASNNNLSIEDQRRFELSAPEDPRIPEGSIRNMRQLMLNLENAKESGDIARDPALFEFAQNNGIADLKAGALKHASSQAEINAVVDKVSRAAKPYLTQEFIDSWRAKWIK